MPRAPAGHPKVVPGGSVNLAFLGQFAETPRNAFSRRNILSARRWRRSIRCVVSNAPCQKYREASLMFGLPLQAAAGLQDGEKVPMAGMVKSFTDGTEIGGLLHRYGLV